MSRGATCGPGEAALSSEGARGLRSHLRRRLRRNRNTGSEASSSSSAWSSPKLDIITVVVRVEVRVAELVQIGLFLVMTLQVGLQIVATTSKQQQATPNLIKMKIFLEAYHQYYAVLDCAENQRARNPPKWAELARNWQT